MNLNPELDGNTTESDLQEILNLDNQGASQEGHALNRLNALGNQAIDLKLIGAHGFHRGQYELLREGKFLLMSPIEALHYLENLIETAGD